jgi:hypothetical protein
MRGQAEAEPYVLLDQEHRRAGLVELMDQAGDPGETARVETQRRLVEQNQLGIGHETACDLHHPPLATTEVPGVVVRPGGHDGDTLLDHVEPLPQKLAVLAEPPL